MFYRHNCDLICLSSDWLHIIQPYMRISCLLYVHCVRVLDSHSKGNTSISITRAHTWHLCFLLKYIRFFRVGWLWNSKKRDDFAQCKIARDNPAETPLDRGVSRSNWREFPAILPLPDRVPNSPFPKVPPSLRPQSSGENSTGFSLSKRGSDPSDGPEGAKKYGLRCQPRVSLP